MSVKKKVGGRRRKVARRLVGVAKDLAAARRRAERADPQHVWSYTRIATVAGVAAETVYRTLTGKTVCPRAMVETRLRVAIAAMDEAAAAARAAA